ncbi:DUF2690 domain-containing protein [Micromonospora sp. NPDC049060]|uniref:DUF2690 domain-containing protein n=1 Tax=Micromonospora sp. NPDC049060 TaxID=3154828 RepID=UPI0033E0E711
MWKVTAEMILKERAKRLLSVFAAVLALGTGLAVVAGPASPALAACSGSSCNGKDPNANGCTATTPSGAAFWHSSYSVEMRRSSNCAAIWTRVTIDDYLPTCCLSISISIERQLYTPYGYSRTHYYTKEVGAGLEGSWWTVMTQNTSDDRHRSCERIGTSAWDCTAWIY